ncbi:hypothetical protein B296_00005746 [Ensete ventricosum]|uniref:Uncharacterized protein n=1 Tax=Ensete ventricosum TaxID=4639 RepID=A0A427BB59_ENSVE|nr:hypothetical protein B296_00005746 [Ensete ventricosum]
MTVSMQTVAWKMDHQLGRCRWRQLSADSFQKLRSERGRAGAATPYFVPGGGGASSSLVVEEVVEAETEAVLVALMHWPVVAAVGDWL